MQSFVQVIITSPKNNGKDVIVSADKLRFVAKGYLLRKPARNTSLEDDTTPNADGKDPKQLMNSSYRANSMADNQASSTSSKYAGANKPMNTANANPATNQMNSGMALLYPAPCIIMAIPPLNGNGRLWAVT